MKNSFTKLGGSAARVFSGLVALLTLLVSSATLQAKHGDFTAEFANALPMEPVTIVAQASCEDADGNNAEAFQYFIRVDTVFSDAEGPYDVTVGSEPAQTYDPTAPDTLFFGPFDHSMVGGAVQVVTATSTVDATSADFVEVPEVVCGVTPDGGQESGSFCMPTTDPDVATGSILVQSAPGTFMAGGTSGQVQAYVVVDSAGFIVQSNMTGLFTELPSDTFMIFAINYRDTEPLDEFLEPGQSFQPVLDGAAGDPDSPLSGACFTICNTDPVIMVPVNCLSIGSTVFADENNDATYDPATEMGIAGVDVNLFAESDPVGAPGVFDSLVAMTTTDADGNYFFGGLDEGDYVVTIPTTPDGFPISSTDPTTPEDVATGDNMDSGIMQGDSVVSPVISLMAQMEPEGADETGPGGDQDDDVASATSTSDDDANGDMTVDFGFFAGLSLGSTVYQDLNNNATQDMGEMGIPGVEVTLYAESDPIGAPGVFDLVVETVTTDAMGNYLFEGLAEGDYIVGVAPDDMFPLSSTGGTADPNDDADSDDNGIFSDLMGGMMLEPGMDVFSGVVTLSAGDEPTDTGANSTSTGMEDGQGADQDGMADSVADANGNMTVDFGFFPGLALGSTVFEDTDNNGILDDDEEGIEGVLVQLLDMNMMPIDTAFTDADGNYLFTGLSDGTYFVSIPMDEFGAGEPLEQLTTSSTDTETGDEDIDNNDNGIQAAAGEATTSGPIVLMLGTEPVDGAGDNDEAGTGADQDNMMDANGNMTVDFGFFAPVSIGSQVFYDADNSGDDNGGTEPGIDGVTVELFMDTDGDGFYTPGVDMLVATTTTMNGGLYFFGDLAPGDYIVGVTPPDTARLSSTPTGGEADDQVDGNDNGIQENVGDVIYSAAISLAPGEETLDETSPGGDQDEGADANGDMTVDFGLVPSVSVGSSIFADLNNDGIQNAGEDGIEGVIVTLLDDMGNVVAMDTTDADGNYFFDGLVPGDYQLAVLDPLEDFPTSSTNPATADDETTDEDDNGNQEESGGPVFTNIFTLQPNMAPTGEVGQGNEFDDVDDDNGNSAFDFGFVPDYSIGSTVFADLNNNSMQDADEEGVPGVEVTLYDDVDGDGVFSAADTIVAMTVTDDDGNYFFDGLLPNDYIVGIVPTEDLPLSSNDDEDVDDPDAAAEVDGDDNGTQADGTGSPIYSGAISLGDNGLNEPTGADEGGQGGDQDDASDIQDAAGNMTVDFGLFPGVSLGSTVFADEDGDGVQGADEVGIPGATVILYGPDADGNLDSVYATVVTDDNGDYFFDGLPEGDYIVAVVPTEDFPVSSDDPGTAGDEMTDGDDDGQFSDLMGGMMLMSGDTVYSGVVNLTAGDEPVGADEGEQGGDQDDESPVIDANGNMTVDFGFTPGVSVGSTVFFDNDNDGLFEPSDGETGIAGVQVFLYAADGMTVLDSTVTDDDGNYLFEGLDPGMYQVGIPESSFAPGLPLESAPASSTTTEFEGDNQLDGSDNGMQPDGAGTLVLSGVIDLQLNGEPVDGAGAGAENGTGAMLDNDNDDDGDMTIDFGFFPTMSIGSQVFLDLDNSGDDNGGTEPGIEGVEVLLFADTDGDNMYTPGVDMLVDMTVTDANGLYEFDTLPPGDYIVAIIPPADNNLSSNGPGESTDDDQVDGNDNGIQAMAGDTVFSAAINLAVGEEPEGEAGPGGDQDTDDDQDDDGDMTVDFGLLPSVSVGSSVFQDDNGDGIQDAGEEGVEGIIITLLDDEGNVVAMDTTDMDGNYFFDGLTPGDYELVINMVPDSLPNSSDFPAGEGDDGVDGNDNGIQDGPGQPISSGIFTLTPNGEPTDEDGPGSDQDDDNEDDGDMSIDFGLVPNYSLGSTIFADNNNNATQDDDEEGVPGVEVNLYLDTDGDGVITSADSLIATTTTDDDGNYFFENLLPGDYGVAVVPTEEFPLSSDDDADSDDANDNTDGDDNGMQAMAGDTIFSSVVTLGTDGEDEPTGDDEDGQGGDQDDDSDLEDASGNMTLDIGLFPGVSVGSTVFADLNNDGINNSDEGGISGITVILFDATTGLPVDTTITDDNGNYLFDGLPEGDYFILIPGDQLVGGNGLFDMDASSSTPDNDADADVDNNDDGMQDGGAGTDITSGVFTLSAGDEPENGIGGEQNGGAAQDDANDANGNMTIDFGLFVPMFDLALIKDLAPGQSPNVEPGDTVAFQITVLNQGNLAADSIVISDYVPTQQDGFLFDPTLNPDWMVAAVNGDTTRIETIIQDFNGADTLAMDSFITVEIFLIVNPAMEAQMALTNLAEISDATGPMGEDVTDIDSPMDTIPGNDNFFEDNEIDGNGLTGGDEDNSDPATVVVGGFDLALIKTLSDGQAATVSPGDNVSFDITVINQGAIIADNIVVGDYVPAGFTFDPALNPDWTLNDDGIPVDTLSTADGDFEMGLNPGESTTTQIVLTVAGPMFPDFADVNDPDATDMDGVEPGQPLVNEAEIVSATDGEGNEVDDIDSNSDATQGNDGDVDDDDVNGGGDTDGDGVIDDDEDDTDIAIVTVECFQDPGVDNTIQVCLGCDEAVVTINLFESLAGLPNIGGEFAAGALTFMDEDGNAITIVDGDGNELGSDDFDPTDVVIPGTLDRSLDYSITYTTPAINDCPEQTATLTIDIVDIQNLSCTGFQNISLGEDCEAEITPDLILQGNMACANSLEVVLLTLSGDTLRDASGMATNVVGSNEVDQTLYVSLVDPMCDNSCWGQITVEDKKRPTIECPDDADGFNGIDFICTDFDQLLLPNTITYAGNEVPDFLDFTGAPVVDDNCTPLDQLVVEVRDLELPNADIDCNVRTILRTFTVTDLSGNSASCVQEITVRPPTLADVILPNVDEPVEIECNTPFDALPNGNPVPAAGGQPSIQTAFGIQSIPGNAAYCNIAAAFSDTDRITTCPNTFKFVRTYTILDWCDAGADALTYSQVVKVGDFSAPEFTITGTDGGVLDGPLVIGTNVSDECAAVLRLDDGITLTDNCSEGISLIASIFVDGDSTDVIGSFTVNVFDNQPDLSERIPAGDHIIRYTYQDDCGNIGVTDVDITIVDRTPPVAICEDGLNISLSGNATGGTAVLTPDMIDANSYDNCSGLTYGIAFVDTTALDANTVYSQQIELTCADLGVRSVGLRVADDLGNENFCWLNVLVEDKLAPACVAPADREITCVFYNENLPEDITDATDAQLDGLFGQAAGADNCETNITQGVSANINSCGIGTITRTFSVLDGRPGADPVICTQVITVVGIHDYQIIFPMDEEATCLDGVPAFDGIQVPTQACDQITSVRNIDTLTTEAGDDACYKLRITYDVINWCEYSTLGAPYVISRDGMGLGRDPENSLLYLNVTPGASTSDIYDDRGWVSTRPDRFPGASTDRDLDDNDNVAADDDYAGNANDENESRGYFRYTQFVKVYDDEAPTITFDADNITEFGGQGEECSATVTFAVSATDNCTTPSLSFALDADFTGVFAADNAAQLGIGISTAVNADGQTVVTATNVPPGTHAIRVEANDGCGNTDLQLYVFTVSADRTPTPICIENLTVTLMPDGTGGGVAAIWANDFIASDIFDCFGNPIDRDRYSIYRESAALAAGEDFNPTVGVIGIEDLTCADVPEDDDNGDVVVRVYAFDGNGSTPDFCRVVVNVQDNMNLCEDDGSTGDIAGLIVTEEMEPVQNVVVDLTGSNDVTRSLTTTDDGVLFFGNLEAGADYTVTPSHFTDYLNGVRTSDIVAATRHILGVQYLETPYLRIAADVNGDQNIDVGDIITIRSLILGLIEEFPNGTPSWTFVPTGYDFPQPDFPWAEAFPEVFNVNDLTNTVTNADFVGVKMGDLNRTAVANLNAPGVPRNFRGDLEFELDEIELVPGETYTVPVTSAQLTEVDGYQFTLEFDRTAISIEGIEPGLVTNGNFGFRFVNSGMITTSWSWSGTDVPADWTGEEVLFSLVVRAEAPGVLSEAMHVGNRFTEAEAYERSNPSVLRNLVFVFNEEVVEVTGYRLLQNQPNPVRGETLIGYELPQDEADVTITITDAAGRTVRTIRQEGTTGYNSLRVSKKDLKGASGVYSYTVSAGEWTATKRMIVVE